MYIICPPQLMEQGNEKEEIVTGDDIEKASHQGQIQKG
jgi:hypothetical protein